MNIVSETSKQVGSFIDALKREPLSLALCVMNGILLIFLFYNGATVSAQRQETVKMLVNWQEKNDRLMASCVSADIMQMVLQALKQNGFTGRKPAELEPPKQ